MGNNKETKEREKLQKVLQDVSPEGRTSPQKDVLAASLILSRALLDRSIELSELDGVHKFNLRLAGVNNSGLAGLGVNALDVDELAGSLGLSLGSIVGTDALVADDADGVLRHVEDLARLSVVELVGHTALDGTVSNDVNVVTLLVRDQVLAEGSDTVLSESLGEEISRASSKTEAVGHFSFKPSKYLIPM